MRTCIVAHMPHAHVGCNVVQTLHQIEGQQCSMPEARPMAVSRVSSSIIAARGRRLGEVRCHQAAPVKTGKKTSGEPSTTVHVQYSTVRYPFPNRSLRTNFGLKRLQGGCFGTRLTSGLACSELHNRSLSFRSSSPRSGGMVRGYIRTGALPRGGIDHADVHWTPPMDQIWS